MTVVTLLHVKMNYQNKKDLKQTSSLFVQVQFCRSLHQKLKLFLMLGDKEVINLQDYFFFTSTLLAQGVLKNWFHFRVGASATFLVLIKCFVSNTEKLASCSERFLAAPCNANFHLKSTTKISSVFPGKIWRI